MIISPIFSYTYYIYVLGIYVFIPNLEDDYIIKWHNKKYVVITYQNTYINHLKWYPSKHYKKVNVDYKMHIYLNPHKTS